MRHLKCFLIYYIQEYTCSDKPANNMSQHHLMNMLFSSLWSLGTAPVRNSDDSSSLLWDDFLRSPVNLALIIPKPKPNKVIAMTAQSSQEYNKQLRRKNITSLMVLETLHSKQLGATDFQHVPHLYRPNGLFLSLLTGSHQPLRLDLLSFCLAQSLFFLRNLTTKQGLC